MGAAAYRQFVPAAVRKSFVAFIDVLFVKRLIEVSRKTKVDDDTQITPDVALKNTNKAVDGLSCGNNEHE